MKRLPFFLIISCLLIVNQSFAKGGGHRGGGGHSGGHSGGYSSGHAGSHGFAHSSHSFGGHAGSGARVFGGHVLNVRSGSSFATRTYGPKGNFNGTTHTHGPLLGVGHGRSIESKPGIVYSYIPSYPRYSIFYPYSYPYYYNYWNSYMYGGPQYYYDSTNYGFSPGYIVYGNDTLSGKVALVETSIYLKDNNVDSVYKFRISDYNLHTVKVFNDSEELTLVRLRKNDKDLVRVVHQGKVTIYDDYFDFLSKPADVDINGIELTYAGHLDTFFWTLNVKKKFVSYLNQAYGLSLDYKKYKWKDIWAYVDKLD
ncbi:MAG TPA: hypothetical protein VN721_15360 [Flavipsychrobacter sp.]|nr:hypothetical protein [Flavipsychrobacter sp.]